MRECRNNKVGEEDARRLRDSQQGSEGADMKAVAVLVRD
jgi:hypothetical protein